MRDIELSFIAKYRITNWKEETGSIIYRKPKKKKKQGPAGISFILNTVHSDWNQIPWYIIVTWITNIYQSNVYSLLCMDARISFRRAIDIKYTQWCQCAHYLPYVSPGFMDLSLSTPLSTAFKKDTEPI